MLIQPLYETNRLFLCLVNEAQAGPLLRYYLENRDFLEAFELERPPMFYSMQYHQAALLRERRLAEKDRSYRFCISRKEDPSSIIGMINLNEVVRGSFLSCFLGYKLDYRYLRIGLMTEAVGKACAIAFGDLGLHRIEANIMPRNKASIGVVKKCGFVEEGLSPKYLNINGVWEDHIHMVLRNRGME
jgi:ribosomal-protein-alanine N-acetyltransferase